MSKRRTVQAPKVRSGRNEPLMRGMQELRRGNAAGPHKPKNSYRRKPKHGAWG